MKPHLLLVIISALLATASAKDGYYAFVETDAATNAFIRDTVPYKEYTDEHKRKAETDKLSCAIAGQTLFNDYALIAPSFFSKDSSTLEITETGLRAEHGSIIFDNISIKNSDLQTVYNGQVDDTWGLPQIALRNVNFLPENTASDPSEFTSNYSTVNVWKAENCTLKLMGGGGAFTSGTVNGNVAIVSADSVKFDGLNINGKLTVQSEGNIHLSSKSGLSQLGQGTLELKSGQQITLGEDPGSGENIHVIQGNVVVDYTGVGGGAETWDVDVKSKMEGSFTVTASNGRVNVGILSGTGNLTARQIYLTSFNGSTLSLQAGESVMLKGGVIAADTVSVAGGQLADITFQGDIQAGGRVSLEGKSIAGEDDESTVSAASLVASAAGDFSIAGGLQISGGQQSTITSTEGRVIFQGATDKTNLTNTAIHASTVTMNGMTADNVQITGTTGASAAAVSYSDKLVLKNQSSIKGNVTGSTDSCIIQVIESRIDGVVSTAAELTLDSATIEGAESVFKLVSKGISQISNQENVTVGTLSLGGGTLTLGTPESHGNNLVMQKLTVDASTILNANLVANDRATLKFSENSVVTLGCTVTLMGDVDFIVSGEGLLMDSVEDVLGANGQSITLSWGHSADLPVWHKELYEAADARGNTFYTTNAAAPGATLSMLQLVYDRTMQDNGCLRIAAIPEPATATLSLLALAALCARRRRGVPAMGGMARR